MGCCQSRPATGIAKVKELDIKVVSALSSDVSRQFRNGEDCVKPVASCNNKIAEAYTDLTAQVDSYAASTNDTAGQEMLKKDFKMYPVKAVEYITKSGADAAKNLDGDQAKIAKAIGDALVKMMKAMIEGYKMIPKVAEEVKYMTNSMSSITLGGVKSDLSSKITNPFELAKAVGHVSHNLSEMKRVPEILQQFQDTLADLMGKLGIASPADIPRSSRSCAPVRPLNRLNWRMLAPSTVSWSVGLPNLT